MKLAIAYLRCSTIGQATDGVSLATQRTRIVSWCELNDYRLVHVFEDAGISGSKAHNRPGLQDALSKACEQKDTALVVYSLSRLARSTRDAITIAERIDKAGCDLVSLSERIDTTTATGKMVFRTLAVLAEFERDLVSERTKAALQTKKARGERTGMIPFGHDLDSSGVMLIENPMEQSIIRDIRAMRSGGKTLQAIADALTERGVSPKNGGKAWGHTSVRAVLLRVL